MIGSSSGRSITWPLPPLLRPRAAPPSPRRRRTGPATMSASASGGSTGGRSAKPFLEAKPDIASTSVPKPGRSRYGPSWPKPVMRTMTSAGLRACSTSGAEPHLLQRAGPEILDQHVAVRQQVEQHVAPGLRRAGSAPGSSCCGHRPSSAGSWPLTRQARSGSPFSRVLDLDHLGALIGQLQAHHVAGDQARQVDHADAVQRRRGGRVEFDTCGIICARLS